MGRRGFPILMSRAVLVCLVLVGTLLAGCVSTEPPAPGTTGRATEPLFSLAGATSHGESLLYTGTRLVGEEPGATNSMPPFLPQPAADCRTDNCERIPLEVHAPLQRLEIGFEWEGQDETWETLDGPGYYLGDAAVRMDAGLYQDGTLRAEIHESSHYGGAAIIKDLAPGDYEIRVTSIRGTSTYLLALRVPEAAPATLPGVDLLPDLVALPPDHPTFRVPIGHDVGTTGTGADGCGPDELAEDRDLRCLRFAGIIGNQGPGDFLTVLEYDQAGASVTGTGHWEQIITNTDGSQRRIQIGPADYHGIHGHFHILDFVATQLYTYDLDTETRGEPVGDGRKMGFCVIDGGIIDLDGPLVPPQYHGSGCCYMAGICQMDMLTHEQFSMGISPNWYDIYPWWRSDQYVEVSGLADGIYELVTVINPDGLIEESDRDNNEGSAVLRVTGDRVEVLSMSTQAKLGPHPDADWGYAAQQTKAETT